MTAVTLLAILNLSNNRLESTIPEVFASLDRLKELHLDKNNFFGKVPKTLSLVDTLAYCSVEMNSLVGKMPNGICSLIDHGILGHLSADCAPEAGSVQAGGVPIIGPLLGGRGSRGGRDLLNIPAIGSEPASPLPAGGTESGVSCECCTDCHFP